MSDQPSQPLDDNAQDGPEGSPENSLAERLDAAPEQDSKPVHEAVPERTVAPTVLHSAGRAESAQASGSLAVLAVGGGIEINGLQPNQVSALQKQHAKGLIEVQRKASELKVDIQALDQTLESLTSQARSANDAGVNITATHTQSTTLGQTEIIVGNTQRAATGKVAPFWAGFDDNHVRTGLIVAAAVVAGALLTALFF